jgi:hypothetical protein
MLVALTPQDNTAFLREVDEELRREQAATLFRRYGIAAILGVVLLLAALGGWFYWRHHRDQVAEAQAAQYQAALDSLAADKPEAAAKPLAELAGSDIAGYRALSRFFQADVLLVKKDLRGAAAKFGEAAKDEGVGQPFRDLALIRQTNAEFDSLKPEVVVQRLRTLAVPGNPWFGSAGELVAAAYIKQGRRDLAGALLKKMAADKDVPESLRQRAIQLAGVMGVDAVGAGVDKAR